MLAYDLVPAEQEPAAGLVVVLHGLGDTRAGWRPILPYINLPQLAWALVEAPTPYGPGFSWFRTPSIDPGVGPEQMLTDVRAVRPVLTETIAALADEAGVDPDRVALMGFSQGCLMVLDQAVHADDPFAGVVALSGWLAEPDADPNALGLALAEQQVLWLHGEFDPVIPVARSHEGTKRLMEWGVEVEHHVHAVDHSIHPDEGPVRIHHFLRKTLGLA